MPERHAKLSFSGMGVFILQKAKRTKRDKGLGQQRGKGGYMIKLKNISKSFEGRGEKTYAVRGVSLEIEQGEIFGIIGFSGAGKSTLIRIFNQLEEHDSGEIHILGKSINHASHSEIATIRKNVGMIFQHFNLLWSRTVQKNIELPLEIAGVPKKEREKRSAELVKLVGLEGREKAYPSELSGGQKQRVGIARALANKPEILLCDEATSALDPKTTEDILLLLAEINQQFGITIVMISHQMEVVRRICHRVAVMSEGKIVESGSACEVFENPKHDVTKQMVVSDDYGVTASVLKEYEQEKGVRYANIAV